MNSQEEHIKQKAKAIIDQTILNNLNEQLNALDEFLNRYEEISSSYNAKVGEITSETGHLQVVLETLGFRQNIFDLFEKHRALVNPQNADVEFKSYREAFSAFIESLPEDSHKEQSADLFSLKIGRPAGMQFLIALKRLFWQFSLLPHRMLNLWKGILGKKKKPLKYWKHKIPWKRITKLHFEDNFGIDMLPVYEQLFRLESQILIEMGEIGAQIDQDFLTESAEEIKNESEPEPSETELPNAKALVETDENNNKSKETKVQTIAKIEIAVEEEEGEIQQIHVYYRDKLDEFRAAITEFRETLPEKITHRFEKTNEFFSSNVLKVGTIELPLFKYRKSVITAREKSLNEQYQRLKKAWGFTFDCIWDTKLYMLEIKMLRYFNTKEYFRLQRSYKQRINSNIMDELGKLNEFILSSKSRISSFEGDDAEFRKLLFKEKDKVKKTLTNDLTPKTVEFILNQELPKLLLQSEQALKRRIEQVATSRSLCPEEHKSLPIAKSEKVNLKQMIVFEALPQYSKESKIIRTQIFEDLNKIQAYIVDINQIVEFTIESSLAAEKKEGEESPQVIAEQGLERALSRTEDVHNELHDIFGEVDKNLKAKVLKFNQDLTNLLDVSDIAQIRARINKTMALTRTMEVRKNVLRVFLNIVPFIFSGIKLRAQKIKAWTDEKLQWLGLGKPPEVISSEIADFLAATKSSVAQLPFVYQRLFKLEPLEDDHFYLPRDQEIKEITKAIENWEMGHFASSVVVGERGSGVTTLLLHFQKTEKTHKVIKGEVSETCFLPNDFQDLLNKIFETPKVKNIEETIEMLNSFETPRIVVLQDMQRLFLKVVDGFSALTSLLEIISETNGKIFWLLSCSSQAWDFLCKSICLHEYFAYVIKLKELPNEDIIETISKRHRVSGYDEKFLVSEKVKNSKKFKRIPIENQQEYLKTEYFSRLSGFAKSNISLAILFWLRSTQNVEGNTIQIGIEEPNFSFLDALSTEKLFIIYLTLLHNGLSEKNLALIQKIPVERARLELINLQDDGILVKESKNYEVNLFLYRPLLRLLREKNIIH